MRRIHSLLIDWFEKNKRILPWRETTDPYRIWLSEIMLQQTRVEQAIGYYTRFLQQFPTLPSLADAKEEDVLLLWQGLGYYSRARNLYKAAIVMAQHFPTTWDEWRKLPGIGDYTAGAICSFAYNLPYPAMDGNVYRVLARLYDCEMPFDTTEGKKHFRQYAIDLLDTEHPRLWNQAIMEFGAIYCVPQHPDCDDCPINHFCKAYKHRTVELLPVRKPRPSLKDRYLNYTIYIEEGTNRTLIHQRTKKDIWQHLWEFVLTETDSPVPTEGLSITHILSHQRLHTTFVIQHIPTLPHIKGYTTISLQDLQKYPLSQLTRKVLTRLFL